MASSTSQIGRRSIFRGKVRSKPIQAILSPAGWKAFKQARGRLAKLARRRVGDISQADVIEFLARGEADTVKYLKG